MIYKFGFFCLFVISLFSEEHVYLKTPNLSREELIGTTVGIRPYRKTGVRLEAERLQNKLLIHNYGYGGSGLTLSFGGSSEVLALLDREQVPSKVIAVLGAGVVGLTTAYDLLKEGYEVHVYSDKWSPNLTSNVAAGIWSPLLFPLDMPEAKKMLHQRMLKIAEQRFLKSTGNDPEFTGVKFIAYYRFNSDNSQKAMNPNQEGKEVVVHLDNGLIKNARRTYRLGIDGQLFMEDLYAKVKNKGAVLIQKHFENLEELLSLEEPIIVNCMSLGTRELFNDQEFIPVRGQMLHFKQNGIDYVISQAVPVSLNSNGQNSWFAIYPWSDRIIVGGINDHEEELIVDQSTVDKIIQHAEKCLVGDL